MLSRAKGASPPWNGAALESLIRPSAVGLWPTLKPKGFQTFPAQGIYPLKIPTCACGHGIWIFGGFWEWDIQHSRTFPGRVKNAPRKLRGGGRAPEHGKKARRGVRLRLGCWTKLGRSWFPGVGRNSAGVRGVPQADAVCTAGRRRCLRADPAHAGGRRFRRKRRKLLLERRLRVIRLRGSPASG